VFDWANPTTLSPSYNGPTSSDRYGEYIGGVTFSDNGVTLIIDDSNVSQASQKARFIYGYNTSSIEMRAYVNSDIIITAPEGYGVTNVDFEGAKADELYMTSYDTESTFANGSWAASIPAQEAKFYVDATINCTKITVTCSESNAVRDIIAGDAETHVEEWYDTLGHKLSTQPTKPGLFILKKNNTAKTILIR
jgi:hypothetical protein